MKETIMHGELSIFFFLKNIVKNWNRYCLNFDNLQILRLFIYLLFILLYFNYFILFGE